MPDFYIKQGNERPVISSQLSDSAGTILNLTNATVAFQMWRKGATTFKVNTAATIVTPPGTDGEVTYTFTDADTDTPGRYLGHWVVTFQGGAPETHPGDGYIIVEILGAPIA